MLTSWRKDPSFNALSPWSPLPVLSLLSPAMYPFIHISCSKAHGNSVAYVILLTMYCPVFLQKGKRCIRTKKIPIAIHLEYKNCTSIQTYKPRYCGHCNDGRCCTPHNTKTIQVEFRCPLGDIVKYPVMSITTCVCHRNCPLDNNAFFRKHRQGGWTKVRHNMDNYFKKRGECFNMLTVF